MISLNSCNWSFFLRLDSHVPVKTRSDGALIRCVSVAVATVAITLKARYDHEQELLDTDSECVISGFQLGVLFWDLTQRRLMVNRSKKENYWTYFQV